MAGRGSFIESFPLFGYDLRDYDALFEEKLDLLLKINSAERVSWSGRLRAPIEDRGVYPRPLQDALPIWLAVGGTPASAVRAARLHLPMMLAIIGGMPERFVPFVDLYRQAAAEADFKSPVVGINSHTFVAETSQEAGDQFFPAYSTMMNRIGQERGWSPMRRSDFDALRSERGALLVGSPQQVIDKILFEHSIFGHQRFVAQMSVGTVPHTQVLKSMELFGTKVVPEVRKALGEKEPAKVDMTRNQ